MGRSKCSFEGCGRLPVYTTGRGWCAYHKNQHQTGKTLTPAPPYKPHSWTVKQRFEDKVVIKGRKECWLWEGARNSKGYAHLKVRGRVRFATHIALWEYRKVRVPPRCGALHSCDTPSCVNPWHLRPGGQKANTKDMLDRKRQATGKKIWATVLTPGKVRKIRQMYGRGEGSYQALAEVFGVHHATIEQVVTRRTWKYVK